MPRRFPNNERRVSKQHPGLTPSDVPDLPDRTGKFLHFKWQRINTGSVRHLCFYAGSLSNPSDDPRGPRRTLCGMTGTPNMKISHMVMRGQVIYDNPTKMPPCKYCLRVIAVSLAHVFTGNGSRNKRYFEDLLSKQMEKVLVATEKAKKKRLEGKT